MILIVIFKPFYFHLILLECKLLLLRYYNTVTFEQWRHWLSVEIRSLWIERLNTSMKVNISLKHLGNKDNREIVRTRPCPGRFKFLMLFCLDKYHIYLLHQRFKIQWLNSFYNRIQWIGLNGFLKTDCCCGVNYWVVWVVLWTSISDARAVTTTQGLASVSFTSILDRYGNHVRHCTEISTYRNSESACCRKRVDVK